MEVRIPTEILEEGTEGVISVWLFTNGEIVNKGDVLAEIMNGKAAVQLEAPASGRLSILVAPEIPVRCGDVIAHVD